MEEEFIIDVNGQRLSITSDIDESTSPLLKTSRFQRVGDTKSTEKCTGVCQTFFALCGDALGVTDIGLMIALKGFDDCGLAVPVDGVGGVSLAWNALNVTASIYSLYKGENKKLHMCNIALSTGFIFSSVLSMVFATECE